MDSVPGGETLTAYDFAMDEVGVASSKLARALLARMPEHIADDSHSV